MKDKIKTLIKNYAKVYKQFEDMQDGVNLPKGDQKTGTIAEYYAKCFIEFKHQTKVTYAKSGESFDLSYKSAVGKIVKVQVKGVSAHSLTRIIAPLNLKKQNHCNPFDELYLISLAENFSPVALYINSYKAILENLKQQGDERDRIVGSVMKGKSLHSEEKKGSWLYDFNINKIDELKQSLN